MRPSLNETRPAFGGSAIVLIVSLLVGCGSSTSDIGSDTVDVGVDEGVDTSVNANDAAGDSTVAETSTDTAAESGTEASADTTTDTADSASDAPDATGASCGGLVAKPCPKGFFCQWPAMSCKVADVGGTCVAVPDSCSKDVNPVCGCDGNTYDNACLAIKAGVNVDHSGACGGTTCGGKTGATCTSTEFCQFPAGGVACGAADGTGTCTTRPSICPGVVNPVCGCDGVTYNNSCYAQRSGTDVKHNGACP